MNNLKGKKFLLTGTFINKNGLHDYMVSLGMVPTDTVLGSDFVIHEGLQTVRWENAKDTGVPVYTVDRFVRDMVGVSGRNCDCSQGYLYKGMCSVCDQYWASPVQALQVGEQCRYPTGEGVVVTLVPDVNDVVIVLDNVDGYKRVTSSAVKPLKTDAELAHEKLVDEIFSDSSLGLYRETCETIIKAGYRKLPDNFTHKIQALIFACDNNTGHEPSKSCYHRSIDEVRVMLEKLGVKKSC